MEARPLVAAPVLAIFLLATLGCGVATAADASPSPSKVSLGALIGMPQLIGPVIEIGSNRLLRFQAGVGSVFLLINGATARLVLGEPTIGTRPYLFAGGGVLDIGEADYGEAHGATGFFWFGGGLRIRLSRRIGLFGEIGTVSGLDERKNYESSYPAATAGFLVGL